MRTSHPSLWLCSAGVVLALFSPHSRALTADELIAKNIEARGGAAAIAAIESIEMNGKLVIAFGDFKIDLGYRQINARPSFYRSEATVQGLTQIQAYNGSEGWKVDPFQGRRDPDKMGADEAREMARSADLDGPLVNAMETAKNVTYLGTEDVDGTEAHKLQLDLKDGDTQIVWLDPDYFLEIRVLTQSQYRGALQESETDLGDYEKVNDVYFPFSIESGQKGQPKAFKLVIDSAKANVEVDTNQFQFPGAGQ